MPELSRFYGIRITMNINDHLPSHFHAEHADGEASIAILSGEIIAGGLPTRALRLVQEWWGLHREELEDNWRRRERGETLRKIAPL